MRYKFSLKRLTTKMHAHFCLLVAYSHDVNVRLSDRQQIINEAAPKRLSTFQQ